MYSIDLESNKSKIEKEIGINSRKSWKISQDFESLQLQSDQIIKNRVAKIHSDYLFHLKGAEVFGYKTVICQGGYYSDEISHDDFNLEKLTRSKHSPLDGQIVYEPSNSTLNVDSSIHRKSIDLDSVVGVFSDEPSNYGSFMYRVLPKIKYCLDLGMHDATFFFHEKPYMHEIIRILLGISVKTISHKPNAHYNIDELYLPTLRNKNCLYRPDCLNIYRDGARRVETKGVAKRIYVSRRQMAKTKPDFRVMENETELVDKLEKLGFMEFCPEEHSIEVQIATFRDAEEIVVAGGSALFNLPYAMKAKFIIDLESTNHWIYAHSNILYSVGVPFSIIYGQQLETGFNLHKNWYININDVVKRVERLRFKHC